MRLTYIVGLTVIPALCLPLLELPIPQKAIATSQISQATPDAPIRKGERLIYQGQYAEALEQLEAVVQQAQVEGNTALEADAWVKIAFLHTILGDKDLGRPAAERALALHTTLQNPLGRAEALRMLANAQFDIAPDEEVIAIAQEALAIVRQEEDTLKEAILLFDLGVLAIIRERYDTGLELLEQATELMATGPAEDRLKQIYYTGFANFWQGWAYLYQGEFKTAQVYATQVLTLGQEAGMPLIEGAAWQLSGLSYQAQDDYERAISHFQPAADIFRRIEVHDALHFTLAHMSASYSNQGIAVEEAEPELAISLYESSIAVLEEAIAIAIEVQATETAEQYRSYLSDIYVLLTSVHRDFAHQYLEVGTEQLFAGKPEAALAPFEQSAAAAQKAIEIIQTVEITPNNQERLNQWRYLSLDDLSSAYFQQGAAFEAIPAQAEKSPAAYQLALEAAEAALPYAIASADPRLEAQAYSRILIAYSSLGRAEQNLSHYEASRTAYEAGITYARQAKSMAEERDFWGHLQWLYSDWGNYHREAGEYEEALNKLEQGLKIGDELLALADASTTTDEDWLRQTLKGQMFLHINMARVYSDQGNHRQELAAWQQALEFAEQLPTPGDRIFALQGIAGTYYELTRYQDSLAIWQQLLELEIVQASPATTSQVLIFMALIYDGLGRYNEAIATYEEALDIAQTQENIDHQQSILNNLGTIHSAKGEYEQALERLNQALQLARRDRVQIEAATTPEQLEQVCIRETLLGEAALDFGELGSYRDRYSQVLDLQGFADDRQDCIDVTWSSEAVTISNIASVYSDQGRYQEALDLHETSLEITRSRLRNRNREAVFLSNIAKVYDHQGNYPAALELQQQSLNIRQATGDQSGTVRSLNHIGLIYASQGQYNQAQTYIEQALAMARELGIRPVETSLLHNLGRIYRIQAQYEQAEALYSEGLALSRELGLEPDTAIGLIEMGHLKATQGQYGQAVDYVTQAFEIFDRSGYRANTGTAHASMGNYLAAQGYYAEALEQQQQALAIAQEIETLPNEADALAALGTTYRDLGQPDKALQYYQAALDRYRTMGERTGEASTLVGIGLVYDAQADTEQALDTYEQALAIYRDIGSVRGESTTLTNIGFIHEQTGNYAAAQTSFQQALDIQQAIGARGSEGITLNGLALARAGQNQTDNALDLLQQSLTLHRELGDRPNEAQALSDMGELLAQQGRPELAIVFLKAAVNLTENLRGNIHSLSVDDQVAYTKSVSDRYRQLADLLLEQGKVPEAQQVLDLLKLEELREFNDPTRATWTGSELVYSDPEQAVMDAHGSLVALGIARINCIDDAECNQLDDQLQALKAEYDAQAAQFEAAIRANRADDAVFANPDNISGDAKDLLEAYAEEGQNAVLIYPFVLEDELWLVWAAAGRAIGSVNVPVTQGELAATVQRFGEQLNSPNQLAELQATSHQLYDWIIEPLKTELDANDIDHLIFVSDRVTRYIPMAALYDGKEYLLERYTLSSILAPGLTDMEDRLTHVDESQVLGLGLTQAVDNFYPLPAVSAELDAIVRSDATDATGVYPGQVFLNEDFTLDTLKANVRDHRVLHMATHAAFVPGRAEESFIVLGDGSQLTIPAIEAMEHRLEDLHLVVLSACQTALGGPAGDGTEIAGISSYFLEKGRAEAVIASLWSVNDSSTSILMQRFYELLASGELTKAEALRQAQTSLLYDEDTATRLAAVRAGAPPTPREGATLSVPEGYSHPYYWAPFILIGNGL